MFLTFSVLKLDKSILFIFSKLLNINDISVTSLVSNLFNPINVSKLLHPENIYDISLTLLVSNFDKSKLFIALHCSKILHISVTLLVSKLLKSKDVTE